MISAASFQTSSKHLFSPKPASTGHTLLSSLTPSARFPFRVPEHATCSFPSWNLCSGFAVSSQPPASWAGPSPLSRLSLARNSEGPLLTALPTEVSISIFMHLRLLLPLLWHRSCMSVMLSCLRLFVSVSPPDHGPRVGRDRLHLTLHHLPAPTPCWLNTHARPCAKCFNTLSIPFSLHLLYMYYFFPFCV